MKSLVLALVLVTAAPGSEQKTDTARLAAYLIPFRGRHISADPLGLKGSELARARGQYLSWIDARVLGGADQNAMNRELVHAGLIHPVASQNQRQVSVDNSGWLEEVIERSVPGAADLLEVRLGIGTICSSDETIAVYSRRPLRRLGIINRRIQGTDEQQVPWWFSPLAIGPTDATGHRLLAIGGNSGWCTSNARGGTLRIEDLQDSTMQTLLDRDVSNWSGNDVHITASVHGNTAEFLYEALILGPDVMGRKAIARFSRTGSGLERDAPIALSRTGFIDEWLMMDDAEAAHWSTPEATQHHPQLSGWAANGFSFEQIALCPGKPQTWQIQIHFDKPVEQRTITLNEAGPYGMRVLNVSREPRANCHQAARRELEGDLN
jgi:hypothetical protein